LVENRTEGALTHTVLSGRWPAVSCPFLSCCFAAVAAAAAAAVAVEAAGVGRDAGVEAVVSEWQNLILVANCYSQYHPGRNERR
jgi:hypothetical protein